MSTTDDHQLSQASPPLVYEPPGPGVWEADLDHQDAPRGRMFFDVFCESFRGGFAELFERYGLPLEELRSAEVNGWGYISAKAVGAPEGSGAPPPDFVLKIVSRLHPTLRRRNRTAAAAIRDRLWLADARAWEQERSTWIAESERLDAIVLEELDDAALSALGGEAGELTRRSLCRHFELQGPALAAGRLLVAGVEWDLDPAKVHELFTGASPESAATAPALLAMRQRVREAGIDPDHVTHEQLVAVAADAVEAFMAEWGGRLLTDDVGGPTIADRRDYVADLVRSAGDAFDGEAVFRAARDELRGDVPAADRDRFDELVSDVRQTYWSLDDNSAMVTRVGGSAVRVVQEIERRGIDRGVLEHPGDAELLTLAELVSLFRDGGSIELHELRRRRAELSAASEQPPAVLGGDVHPPPDPSVFPRAMAEVTAAFGAYLANKLGGADGASTVPAPTGAVFVGADRVATGHGLGDEVTARLVVAKNASEAIERVEPGVILVCPLTTPAWNVVFPMLAGIVTEVGTPLGHTGVMAREFGLPAVLGIGDADPAWDGAEATLVP